MTDAGQTIMIVDDDLAFTRTLAAALRRRGYRALIANDHATALAEAEAWQPARAVIDLRMPGRNGLELLADLAARAPGLEIVMLTGYGSIATAVEAIKLGAVHYLTKPASVDEILDAFARTEPVLHELESDAPPPPPTSLDQLEWEHLQRVLTNCKGNVSEAARQLGMHRRTLQRKLARGAEKRELESKS